MNVKRKYKKRPNYNMVINTLFEMCKDNVHVRRAKIHNEVHNFLLIDLVDLIEIRVESSRVLNFNKPYFRISITDYSDMYVVGSFDELLTLTTNDVRKVVQVVQYALDFYIPEKENLKTIREIANK